MKLKQIISMKTHVYSLVLWFVFALLCITTQAQEYTYIPMVKPGIQIWTTLASSEDYQHYNRFALTEEDTIIESETYKKLYWFQDSVFNPLTAECIGGIRENEKKVYYKGKFDYQGEHWHSGMLYDFSLSVGDTFYLREDVWGGFPFEVVAVDTIEINGTFRRQLTLNWYSSLYVCTWTEGVGNNLGLLFDIEMRIVTGGANGELRCYEYNGELQYHQGDDGCGNPYLGLNDMEINDKSITLYPNPTNESITISSDNIIKSIEIYNPLGKKVYQTKVNAKTKSIDINYLSKGIYIIGINTDKGYIKKKFIKN